MHADWENKFGKHLGKTVVLLTGETSTDLPMLRTVCEIMWSTATGDIPCVFIPYRVMWLFPHQSTGTCCQGDGNNEEMFRKYHCSSLMNSILLARTLGYLFFVVVVVVVVCCCCCCCCLNVPNDDIILAHRVLVTLTSGCGFQCADNLGTWKVGGALVALPQISGSEGSVKQQRVSNLKMFACRSHRSTGDILYHKVSCCYM